jgi:ABC-type anion transport system duplicated permease subunit
MYSFTVEQNFSVHGSLPSIVCGLAGDSMSSFTATLCGETWPVWYMSKNMVLYREHKYCDIMPEIQNSEARGDIHRLAMAQ